MSEVWTCDEIDELEKVSLKEDILLSNQSLKCAITTIKMWQRECADYMNVAANLRTELDIVAHERALLQLENEDLKKKVSEKRVDFKACNVCNE